MSSIDCDLIVDLRSKGLSYKEISASARCSVSSVKRALYQSAEASIKGSDTAIDMERLRAKRDIACERILELRSRGVSDEIIGKLTGVTTSTVDALINGTRGLVTKHAFIDSVIALNDARVDGYVSAFSGKSLVDVESVRSNLGKLFNTPSLKLDKVSLSRQLDVDVQVLTDILTLRSNVTHVSSALANKVVDMVSTRVEEPVTIASMRRLFALKTAEISINEVRTEVASHIPGSRGVDRLYRIYQGKKTHGPIGINKAIAIAFDTLMVPVVGRPRSIELQKELLRPPKWFTLTHEAQWPEGDIDSPEDPENFDENWMLDEVLVDMVKAGSRPFQQLNLFERLHLIDTLIIEGTPKREIHSMYHTTTELVFKTLIAEVERRRRESPGARTILRVH